MTHRRLWFAAALVLSALLGGLFSSMYLGGPVDDEAAQFDPEEIWYRVEPQVLAEDLVLRGMVLDDIAPEINANSSGVVTGVFEPSVGEPIVEISGEPVILLTGSFPAYRDLHIGLEGPDVAQLNASLNLLGFDTQGEVFETATALALQDVFESAGYDAPIHTEPQLAELESDVSDLRLAVAQMLFDHDVSATERDSLRRQLQEFDQPPSELVDSLSLSERSHERLHTEIRAVEQEIERLENSIEETAKLVGPSLPRGNVIFVSPETQPSVVLDVGDVISEGDPILREEALLGRAVLQPTESQLARLVLPAVAQFEVGERVFEVSITGLTEAGTIEVPVESDLVGIPVRAAVSTALSDGAVLAVPESAVSTSGESSSVLVRAGEATRLVSIEEGQRSGGWVEVLTGALQEGDEVLIQ